MSPGSEPGPFPEPFEEGPFEEYLRGQLAERIDHLERRVDDFVPPWPEVDPYVEAAKAAAERELARLVEATREHTMAELRAALRACPPRRLAQLLPAPANAVHRRRDWRRPVSVRVALQRARLERSR